MKKTVWADSVVLITGAGSGIGRALALAISGKGGLVIITDIDLKNAEKVQHECGPNSKAFLLDVTNADNVKMFISDVTDTYGHLDYIFNNAGIGLAGEAFEIPFKEWERIIDVNLRGVLHGVLAAYPIMIKQGKGHIINTASLAGLGPSPLLAAYSMTKHAVVGLSTSLRIEAKKYGINVSVLCPPAIETPLLDNTTDLNWFPDMRRFLTRLSGPPYPVNQFAERALRAIERNKNIIIIPGRGQLSWIICRLFPWIVSKMSTKAIALERSFRK